MALPAHQVFPRPKGPLLVVVMDGFGEDGFHDEYDASAQANTPFLDKLRKTGPDHFCKVYAHGTYVGLPSDADMGNSEVGHNALGAGQIYDQGASLVDKAIESESMFTGEGFKYIQPSFDGTVHFIGLLSDGGVHSRYDQLLGTLKGFAARGAKKIRVHTLTDGRDCEDGSSVKLMKTLVQDCKEISSKGCDCQVASGGGRMGVTMDRYESDWNIVKKGYYAHVLGEAPHHFKDANEAIKSLRGDPHSPVSDQWLEPFVIVDNNDKPVGEIHDGDGVVIFNFRADRVIELSKAIEYENFDAFDRKRWPKTRFCGMI